MHGYSTRFIVGLAHLKYLDLVHRTRAVRVGIIGVVLI